MECQDKSDLVLADRDMVDDEKILDVIEECSVTQDDESGEDDHNSHDNHDKNDDGSFSDLNNDTSHTIKSTAEFEFSLSSITFALGDVLQGSAAKLGDAIIAGGGKLSLNNNNNSSNKDALLLGGNNSSHHSLSLMRLRSSHHGKKQPRVDFGHLEERAVRLQYTADDVFEIVNDPIQFQELRNALRTMGAVTNTLIKQKLHWYVKNNKRERARQQELLLLQQQQQQQQQQQLQWHQQEEREQRQQESAEPVTPPTEPKVMDSAKVWKDNATAISHLDPSPTSVRGIFVPSTSS
jgi:hypothetical protein